MKTFIYLCAAAAFCGATHAAIIDVTTDDNSILSGTLPKNLNGNQYNHTAGTVTSTAANGGAMNFSNGTWITSDTGILSVRYISIKNTSGPGTVTLTGSGQWICGYSGTSYSQHIEADTGGIINIAGGVASGYALNAKSTGIINLSGGRMEDVYYNASSGGLINLADSSRINISGSFSLDIRNGNAKSLFSITNANAGVYIDDTWTGTFSYAGWDGLNASDQAIYWENAFTDNGLGDVYVKDAGLNDYVALTASNFSQYMGISSTGQLSLIPEPSTYALIAGIGLLGMLAIRRRK